MATRKITKKKSTKSDVKSSKGTSPSKTSRRQSAAKSSASKKKKRGTPSKVSTKTAAKRTQKAALSSARRSSSKSQPAKVASIETSAELRPDTKPFPPAKEGKSHSAAFVPHTIEALLKPQSNESEAKLSVEEALRNGAPTEDGSSSMAAKPRAANPSGVAAGVANTARSSENMKDQRAATRDALGGAQKAAKPSGQRQGFKLNEYVVYPAHGVGQIVAIEDQEVAGFRLELFVINFSKDKMTLRVPTSKVTGVGLRKISDPDTAKRSLDILTGRARIKRTMWSRRAQEYETKINSGDIRAIAEVVRDLYRSEAQPEQSYSERQLYEAALDRMVREIAAVQRSAEIDALKMVEAQLQKGHTRNKAPGEPAQPSDGEIEEAA